MAQFEYRIIVTANLLGAQWETDWEPWEGPEE